MKHLAHLLQVLSLFTALVFSVFSLHTVKKMSTLRGLLRPSLYRYPFGSFSSLLVVIIELKGLPHEVPVGTRGASYSPDSS